MRFISEADYYSKLDNPEIKAVLPLARSLAISRSSDLISTIEVLCAIILQDPELVDKLNEKYGIGEISLKKYIKENLPNESDFDVVNEFEELQITPRVDKALKSASFGRDSISSKDLLRVLLSDHEIAAIDFLIGIGIISNSYTEGNIQYIGIAPKGEKLSNALKEFTDYMLEES